MKELLSSLAMAVTLLCSTSLGAQSAACKQDPQFPGTYLKWLKIAEPVFEQKHLNLEKYNIVILDFPKSSTITVLLRSTDAACEGMGSTGTRPDFEVAISTKDMTVMHSEYVR